MKKIYLFFSLALAVLPSVGYSQYYWSRFTNHNEYIVGLGASQFLGDLGGSSTVGSHFLKDFNFSAIRYAFEGGYRYHISPTFCAKGMLTLGMVSGNDALSKEKFRHNRNLNFRSPIIELTGQFEYYFYKGKQVGHRYHIKHAKGFKKLDITAYLFAGFGGFYFNPQGKYLNGAWYSLRPFSTEGEGLPNGTQAYSRFSICIPVGIGMKYSFNPQWSMGMEISDRIWTQSDFIDDTHNKYYDKATITAQRGPVAGYFADPSLGDIPAQTVTGQERGDPTHNDTYMFLYVTVSYTPPYHKRTRSKF